MIACYQHHPVPGYDVGKVRVIHYPEMNKQFSAQMALLQQRKGNPRYLPNWLDKTEPSWRAAIHQQLETLTKPNWDEDYPDVKLLPLWHGTQKDKLNSLLSAGYTPFCTTDNGYFGKGIYAAHEAAYAAMYANAFSPSHQDNGILILNWVTFYSALPIIDQDYDAHHKCLDATKCVVDPGKYDAHFIPVVQRLGADYIPTHPNQAHHFTEVMVTNTSQIVPRYLVELQPSVSGTASQMTIMFGALKQKLINQEETQRQTICRDCKDEQKRLEWFKNVVHAMTAEHQNRKKLQEAYDQVVITMIKAFQSERPNIQPAAAAKLVLPVAAKRHEQAYQNFLNLILVYKPYDNSDKGKVILPVKDLENPLDGVFDLSNCGDAAQRLSISTGYRKGKNPANANKLEIWLTPRFVAEQNLNGTAAHLKTIWDEWHAARELGVFFTWGNWDNEEWYDYEVHINYEVVSAPHHTMSYCMMRLTPTNPKHALLCKKFICVM